MAEATLLKMAAGGVCDHLGGGFHRYSVDELWHVPHFEKARAAAARAALSGRALLARRRARLGAEPGLAHRPGACAAERSAQGNHACAVAACVP